MSAAAPATEGCREPRPKLREWVLVVALALLPALPLLLGGGMVNTRAGGDSPFLLVRVHQLAANLRAGVLPARWMPEAAYGLGYPFFNFYASLPYYLAAVFNLAGPGYIAAIQLTQILGLVFAALAVYGFSRELRRNVGTSLLIALAYSCAPFHMVNAYVRGDSLSEFYAFVFFPLILWTLLRLRQQPSIRNMAWAALAYAGLIATHQISAMIFSPFVLLYVICLAWESEGKLSYTVRSLSALAGGLLASAWFWLPALAESRHVYLRDMTTGYFNYAQHFRRGDLIQRSLTFDYAITASQQPFRMGLLQALLALGGLVAILVWWKRQRRIEPQSAFLVLLLAGSTFMITPLSRPLWDHLPLLPLVQFPWRFLSLQALASSLVLGYLVPQGRGERKRRIPQMELLTPALGVLVLATALLGLHPERLLIHESDVTSERLMVYEYFTANVGTTIRTDYLPQGVDPRPYTSEAVWAGEKPKPVAIEGQVQAARLEALEPTSESWNIEVASAESLLTFHTYYFPGWTAHVDGQRAELQAMPGLGTIGLRLPQGQHKVMLRLERTRVQAIAEAVSALTLLLLLGALTVGERGPRRLAVAESGGTTQVVTTKTTLLARRWRAAAVLGAIVALAVLAMGRGRILLSAAGSDKPAPAAQLLDLTMDFDRVPYLHHNPQGVLFGTSARLSRYELSAEAVQAGDTLIVTTYWEDVSATDMTVRVALVSPAQHLFGVPLSFAASTEPVREGAVQHTLLIPDTTFRSLYLLRIQVYEPAGEIQPVTSQGETLGATYLVPVRVHSPTGGAADEPPLQRFGDRISLVSAQAAQQEAGTLQVSLVWNTTAPPAQNYKIALRLRDASGWEVARLDTQPGYGFYPTHMWRPGELVHDRYLLAIDEGTPPGQPYSLDVTLYESASLRPIGTARISGVPIALPTLRQQESVLATFGPALALSEAQIVKTDLEQGEKPVVSLQWSARAAVDEEYACRLALLDEDGRAVYHQTEPLARGYSTTQWPPDALINGRYELQLAPDIAAGEYRMAVSVVEAPSGKEVGSFTLPDVLRIVETQRNFAIPEMQSAVAADFGAQVRLLGYDLQYESNRLRLKLHWQALTAMETNYQVFVHLFDPVTERIVAQQDFPAGGEGYRTTRWVSGEVVSDETELGLEGVSTGTYRLALGLYHPAGRLAILAPSGFVVSADRLLLNETVTVP